MNKQGTLNCVATGTILAMLTLAYTKQGFSGMIALFILVLWLRLLLEVTTKLIQNHKGKK